MANIPIASGLASAAGHANLLNRAGSLFHPGLDLRPMNLVIAQRLIDAQNVIKAKADTLSRKGAPRGDVSFERHGFYSEFEFATV